MATPGQSNHLPEQEFYTTEEAGVFLGLSSSTVRRYRRQGVLPGIKFGRGRNGAVRYRRADLLRIAEELRDDMTGRFWRPGRGG